MNLFNNATLARRSPHISPAPEPQLKALTDWADLISLNKIKKIKETSPFEGFKTKIVEAVLGYTSPVGNIDYTVESEQTILKGSVELALSHFSNGKVNNVGKKWMLVVNYLEIHLDGFGDGTQAHDTKLKGWWLLPDLGVFRTQVQKCFKTDIPLSERSGWEAYITRDRAKIARRTAEITKCEAEAIKQVNAQFGLTDTEIKLLESYI